jgi:hypothetical protein
MVPINGCSFLLEVLCMVMSELNKNIRGADGRRSGFLGVPKGEKAGLINFDGRVRHMAGQKTNFEAYSYRTGSRFGSRVRVSVEGQTVSSPGRE